MFTASPLFTMNALHSPLEALTFNYATFGFFTVVVNNLWTWLALLTAALSLWKIRPRPHLPPPPPTVVVHEEEEELAAAGTSSPEAGVFSAGDGEVDGVTKGRKFTVYYQEEGECESDEELTVTEVGFDGGFGCESEWWEKWDDMLRMRMGVKGWYMCQDLTDLNGNVVRLWDSGINCDMRFAKQASLAVLSGRLFRDVISH